MIKIIKNLFIIFFFTTFLIQYTSSKEKDVFLSLKYNKVKVRHGPSLKHPVKFIYKKKYLPLKVIDTSDKFKIIIVLKNNSGWIHISQLNGKKSAININDLSTVFKKPNIYSKPFAKLEKGKLVTIYKCKKKWCKILINNNKVWIQKKFLWGNF